MLRNLAILAVLSLVALAGCKSTGESSDSGNGSGGGGDQAEMMIKMYEDGQMKASPFIALHNVVNVGQMWDVESDWGAGKSVDKWQVTAKVGRSEFIVENLTGQGYVIAYQVDSWAEAGQPNVKKAWVGKEGGEPKEIQVMEMTGGSGETAAVEASGETSQEPFAGLEIAKKSFDGTIFIAKSGGATSKTWIADNGWFNRIIRIDSNDKTVMQVVSVDFHEKAKPFLAWPKEE